MNGPRAIWALGAACLAAACSPRPAFSGPWPSGAEWQGDRARLESLRRSEPERPYGVTVRMGLYEPRTGRTFDARGALAVDPHRALRLVLLGPGGATALDAWVTPDAYRFEAPPIGLVRRGGVAADPSLPVGFFRWWMLAPVEGRLLASFSGSALALPELPACSGRWFLLRHDSTTVTMCDGPHGTSVAEPFRVDATLRSGGALSRLGFRGQGLLPHEGDRAAYADLRSGTRVDVVVDGVNPEPPDPLAFQDPDLADSREKDERNGGGR